MLDRAQQCELGARVGKPVPVEPTARDAEENHCQSEHCAQYPHAAFENGDPIVQDILTYVVRAHRDDVYQPPLDPRPRRGARDLQLGEEIRVPTADYLRAGADATGGALIKPLVLSSLALLGTFELAMADSGPTDGGERTGTDEFLKATFAGGCFWCMEPPFDALEGVLSTTVGYTGGREPNPTYEEVSSGRTGHAEAIQIVFDPTKVTYEKLLHVFWRNIDPLDAHGQFCDRGRQYRAAIFYHDDTQRSLAEESKKALQESRRFTEPVATEIVPASEFWPAEEYHQDYYRRTPFRYKFYRYGCGRDQRLRERWGSEAST